jgi:CO/xanthine dehydrogenase Mo-binding subunit
VKAVDRQADAITAKAVTSPNRKADPATSEVGRSVVRLESRRKVTGRIEYVHHLTVPGMLYAKVFRSTVAHGRILSIDTTAARETEGVHAVLTGEDILKLVPDPYYGPAFHDQPVLALDKVRFVGEPVAVVLAEDSHIAAAAVQLIVAEYEELPAVFDEVEAATSKTFVHDVLRPAGTFPDLKHLHGRRNTNIALDYQLRRGDLDADFAAADCVFEHEFTTQTVMHVPLEPMVSLAVPEHDRLTIHTASQSPSFVRMEIARLLGWPQNRVRVQVPYLGGGFGAKLYIKLEALVACAALIVRRPVKLALTMEEQFYTITKHATTFRIKSSVTRDGRITGRLCDVFWNGGAYADIGPRVSQKSGFTASGPYDIANVWIDSKQIYTNLPPAGALRGFGIPQVVWAYESHTDLIARALEIDPLEFRRRNILRDARPHATGTPTTDAAISEVLEAVAKAIEWDKPFERGAGPLRRGRGIAIGFKASIAPTTSVAIVTVNADGSVILAISTVDMGQGSDTAMAQIVAQSLGLRAEEITVVHPDTDSTPYDMATLGSRSTFHTGHAVRMAAEDARKKLTELAASLGLPEDKPHTPAELFLKKYKMQAGNIVGIGVFIPPYVSPDVEGMSPNVTPYWMIGATGVEIEVDTETGKLRIERMVSAVDCGKPINPRIVETQVSGAALMQLGFTLFEKMNFDAGQVTNASFADYKIPGIHDVPESMQNLFVDAEQRTGPYGAKGVGESSTFGVSPAIANAIHDAVGVRLSHLPLTPESVLRAIRKAAGNPIED